MDTKQLVVLVLQISIILTVLGFGLKATVGDLLYVVRRPSLLGRSLLAMLILVPILAVLLVRLFGFRPEVEIALVALSISPIPPLLPKREAKAGGQAAYGLGLMALFGLLSIVVVPASLALLGQAFGLPLGMSPSMIAGVMMKMVLIPLAVGVAIRAVAPSVADRLARPVGILATVLLVLGALPLLVVVGPALWGLIGDGTVLAIMMFVIGGLAIGHWLGGPEPGHAVVLALSSACRHPALALAIASANFPEQRFGGTIVLYLIINTLVGIPYLAWQKKRDPLAPLPG